MDHHPAAMDDQDLLDLLELQRLMRELLDHLTGMFSPDEAADLLRVMADGVENGGCEEIATRDTPRCKWLNEPYERALSAPDFAIALRKTCCTRGSPPSILHSGSKAT
jgi:hypothetical protein